MDTGGERLAARRDKKERREKNTDSFTTTAVRVRIWFVEIRQQACEQARDIW